MTTLGHPKPFGLRQVVVSNEADSQHATFPASRTFTITPRFSSGELMGDDALVSVVSLIIGADWTLEAGGIPIDALAIIIGKTAALDGVSPGQTLTLSLEAGDTMPYFIARGRAVGEGIDDIHGKLFRCKCTSLEGSFSTEEFIITSISGVAVKDASTGKVIEWVQHETAEAIPTT